MKRALFTTALIVAFLSFVACNKTENSKNQLAGTSWDVNGGYTGSLTLSFMPDMSVYLTSIGQASTDPGPRATTHQGKYTYNEPKLTIEFEAQGDLSGSNIGFIGFTAIGEVDGSVMVLSITTGTNTAAGEKTAKFVFIKR